MGWPPEPKYLKLALLMICEVVGDKPDTQNPVGVLIRAWLNRPVEGSRNNRPDRILPAKLGQVPPSDRRAGRLFSPAAHVLPDSQLVMPGFGHSEPLAPALPLALYDLGAGADAPGPAAPLALRLFVEAVLSANGNDRNLDRPVALSVPLRDLLDALYPNPNRRPRPNEYWPRLMEAMKVLDSFDARIPWYDPETRKGGNRRVVSVGDIPRGPDALDDLVRLVVDLPPGSHVGPQVSPNLRLWGMKSAAAYRLLLNLTYRWFEPGRTHMPMGKGKHKHWLQVNDPDRYPKIPDAELVRLAFPTSAQKQRRNLLPKAQKALTQLADGQELRIIEGRVLPPARGE